MINTDSGELYINSKGVILSLKSYGDSSIYSELFIMDYGRVYASLLHYSPNKKNISRELQQFLWGNFELIKNKRTHKYYIKDVNIICDPSVISMNRKSLYMALRWSKILAKYLPYQHADNDLLINLRSNMKLLEHPNIVPVRAAEFRFIWLWLKEWGLAPDLINFYSSRGFNEAEVILLTQIQALRAEDVIKLFSYKLNGSIRENSLNIAVKLALEFFHEI